MTKIDIYTQINEFNNITTRQRETLENKYYYMLEKESFEKAEFISFLINSSANIKEKFENIDDAFDLSFGSGNLSTRIILENNIQISKLYLNDKFTKDINTGLKTKFEDFFTDFECSLLDFDFFESTKFNHIKTDLLVFNPTSGGKPSQKDYNKNGNKSDLLLTINTLLKENSLIIFNGKEEDFKLLFPDYNCVHQYIAVEGSNIFFAYKSDGVASFETYHNTNGIVMPLVEDLTPSYEKIDLDKLENNISFQIQKLKPPRDDNNLITISEDPEITQEKIKGVLSFIESLPADKKTNVLEIFSNHHLTNEDINILLGRKKALGIFRIELEKFEWNETKWQEFFDENSWIFGYGLNYQYLKILQKEAHISDIDLAGTNGVIGDFLMGANKFTVLVELKKPDTPLFEDKKNRSESWSLSKDLTYSMSQILAQKAEWQIKSEFKNYDDDKKLIKHETSDPKTILIIGHSNQYQGEDKDDKIKARTFELYRRNSRNIEILTYNELYERADFIVNQNQL